MDKLTPNESKIVRVLQQLDTPICSKDLAELSEVHPNSIGRYLKKLRENKYIDSEVKQIHNRRFTMIFIAEKGKTVKLDTFKVVKESKPKSKPKAKAKVIDSKNVQKIALKQEIKTELRTMILNLVVRKVDYERFKFNTTAEYKNKMIELIEAL